MASLFLSVVACLGLMLLSSSPSSALMLPQAISSNMVLQRGPQQAQVWGTAAAGSVVVLQLDSAQYKTFADADGNWIYAFPAQQASTDRTLTITGDGQTIKLANIAFGDVYVCSGQSNMEMAVSDSFDANSSIPDSINYPNLRLFGIEKKASLTQLNDTMNRWGDGQQWVVSQPEYVGGPSFSYFSATCFYFGRALYKALNSGDDVVPIGLIDTCWGGTRIEAWTTQAGLDTCGPVQSTVEYYDSLSLPQARSPARSSNRHDRLSAGKQYRSMRDINPAWAAPNADPDPQTPSVLYNGMIAPIQNMRVAGATWYQGEANAGNATNYACRFPAMITDWRQQFNNFRMGFYFVLLAAFKEGGFPTWPEIRDAQLAALALPYTGVSSAQDLGDETGPAGAIHPRNKTIVGERLALCAQADLYGQGVVSTGPVLHDVVWPIDGSPVQSVILRFQSSLGHNSGLQLRDTAQCSACCNPANITGSAITVSTTDGMRRRTSVTVDPQAFIVSATVDLSGSSGVNVAAVQLNWEEFPECALYNSQDLPHLPVNIARP